MESVDPPLYTYPDQLISDTWVTWSEKLLSQKHATKYTTRIGFQEGSADILGTATANERTRALELFYSGMLRGVLVNARGTSGVPFGWGLIQGDQNVHSRLGYSAYAIGKALAAADGSPRIESAFSVICTLIMVQSGFTYSGRYISTLALFDWVLRGYLCPQGINKHVWNRYVAAAVFCTLNDGVYGESLANIYLDGKPITSLRVGGQESLQSVDPAGLLNLVNSKYSLTNIIHPKASLFWIGDPIETSPRGIYTEAMLHSSALLQSATALEWSACAAGHPSPFSVFATKNTVGEEPCALDKLGAIMKSNPTTRIEWSKAMKTLFEGTLDAIKYLSDDVISTNQSQSRMFFAHGPQGDPTGVAQCLLRVAKTSCVQKPIQNDLLVFAGNIFRVSSVDTDGDDWKILCALV